MTYDTGSNTGSDGSGWGRARPTQPPRRGMWSEGRGEGSGDRLARTARGAGRGGGRGDARDDWRSDGRDMGERGYMARHAHDPASPDERGMPIAIEAEACLLGSILIDGDVLYRVARFIEPEMFYREAHRRIYAAMLETLRMERVYRPEGGLPADLIQTTEALERGGLLEEVGGAAYVSSLANQVPTSASAERYARLVERTYRARLTLAMLGAIAGAAWEVPDPAELRALALTLINEALPLDTTDRVRWMRDVLDDVRAETEERAEGGAHVALLPSGFSAIDSVTEGHEPGDLIIIAGRPGVGKSALGRRILLNTLVALRARAEADRSQPVGTGLYVTLEMSATQQARAIVATYANLNTRQIRRGFREADGTIDEEARAAFLSWCDTLERDAGGQLAWVDTTVSVEELEQVIAQQVAEHSLRVVLVDQADLLSDDEGKRRTEYDQMSNAIKRMKQIARTYGVVIFCLAQLNREAADVRPRLQHLRNTGRMEQDADVVMLLYRPAKFAPDACADDYYANYLEVILAKVRGGEDEQTAHLFWAGSRQDITDWPPELPLPRVDADDADALGDDGPATPAKRRKKEHAQ